MTKLFGTDGIRARVGSPTMKPDFILKLAMACAKAIGKSTEAPRVVIGRDTRRSGKMLEAALQAGFTSMGVDVYSLGVMPTPGVAYLTRTLHADLGIVISASHNPHYDNGIKFFSPEGKKISDELESEIESNMILPAPKTSANYLGKSETITDAPGRYIEFCKSAIPHFSSLKNLKIVVDCSHGATSCIAPKVFKELGAQVLTLGNKPNGLNINKGCGSTSPEALQAAVIQHQANIGIAFDGDGDRVIMVDAEGCLVDGDQILYLLAMESKRNGTLKSSGVVGTQMSNLGLELALKKESIPFVRTKVGDRYVMQELHEKQWLIGGESSGHIIWLSSTTTGDGIVAALQVLSVMHDQSQTLSGLLSQYEKVPQILLNIPTPENLSDEQWEAMLAEADKTDKALGQTGRVLLRKSGTEPLIRIMVEATNLGIAQTTAENLAKSFKVGRISST